MSFMSDAWGLVTRLGEAQILLPAMFVALLWLVLPARTPRTALWWLAGTAVVALITTATKVAFFGYGIGYAPLDFTGISGHAMFAAAVLPVLAGLLAGGTHAALAHGRHRRGLSAGCADRLLAACGWAHTHLQRLWQACFWAAWPVRWH